MDYQLGIPYFTEQEGKILFPSAGEATGENRLYIVCDNENVGQALCDGIQAKLSEKSRLSQEDFNNVLDDALSSSGQRTNMTNLAFALFQDNGVLVAQMGKSRVLHIAPSEDEIIYDSRDQVLDLYSAKARVQILNQISDNDYIVISLADIVDLPKMVRIAGDNDLDDDEKAKAFFKALSKNKPSLVASYLIHIEKISGIVIGKKMSNINWKRIFAYIGLLAIVAGLAAIVHFCDFSKILSNTSSEEQENAVELKEQPADSTKTDTTKVEPVQNTNPQTQTPVAPAQETKPAEPVKKDTAKVSTPKKDAPKPDAAKTEDKSAEKKAEVKPEPAAVEKLAETPKEPERPASPAPEQ